MKLTLMTVNNTNTKVILSLYFNTTLKHLRTSLVVVGMLLKSPGPITEYALTIVVIDELGGRSLSVYCVSDVLVLFNIVPPTEKPSS